MWPSGWIQELTARLKIPYTPWAVSVFDAWQRSTPTQPFTNNPLGLPAQYPYYPASPGSSYAMYPSMATFYGLVTDDLESADVLDLLHALRAQDDLPAVWRGIHALGWPGSTLEGEYPYQVLLLTSESYIASVVKGHTKPGRTTGVINPAPGISTAVQSTADASAARIASMLGTAAALDALTQRG